MPERTVERTRTYTGTLPVNPAYDAWQQAHDQFCDFGPDCDGVTHRNPHRPTVQMLVHVFEEDDGLLPPAAPQIKGIQVAVHNGEPGRASRWTPPATMTEEV